MPTIRGEVGVTIRNTEQSYTLTLDIPANSSAEVSLPAVDSLPSDATLRLNGRKCKVRILPNNRIDCGTLGSGKWHIELDYGPKL